MIAGERQRPLRSCPKCGAKFAYEAWFRIPLLSLCFGELRAWKYLCGTAIEAEEGQWVLKRTWRCRLCAFLTGL